MITSEELEAQANSLAKSMALNVPNEVSTIVIFFNRQNGEAVLKAVRMSDGLKNEVLKAFVKGYGQQSIEGAVR